MYLSLLWCPTAPFISLVRVPSSHSALRSEKSWLRLLCSCHLVCLTRNAIVASNPCPSPMVRPLKVCSDFRHPLSSHLKTTQWHWKENLIVFWLSLWVYVLARWFSCEDPLLHFHGTRVWFPAPMSELQLQRDVTLLASTGTSSPSTHTHYIHKYFKFIILYCVGPQNGHTRKATENIVSWSPCKDLNWTRYNSTHLWSQLWGCWGRRIANSRSLWAHSKKKLCV